MSDKTRSSFMPMSMPPSGKKMMPTREETNALEEALLGELDPDKLNDLSEVLFALNNHNLGPIPGWYVVVCTKPDSEWCVGQLSADRAKPLIMFENMRFTSPEAAQAAAEEIRAKELKERYPKVYGADQNPSSSSGGGRAGDGGGEHA